MKHFVAALIGVLLVVCPSLLAQPATTFPVREPKYPPKTKRTLYSDEQIALARANVKKYPAAAAIAANVIKSADNWLAWKDEDLRFLLTTPDVPRAFAVSVTGCPVCDGKMKEARGDYGWIIDPKVPFKVKCPVDGTVFPSNDYLAYYRSGFKTKKDWDGKYVDDGWGWTDPKTGEKFWFVAYYNHWMWHKYLVPGLSDLANAYLLTGDKRYAHKAAVMVERIAEVYPGMDLAKQSRYGLMMAARGIDYPGKVVNAIWETGLTQQVCDAYDAVFDSIDGDTELQSETHKTGPEIRRFVEGNFLEDAIDAVFAQKIRGNFGMHQSTLVHLAIVRQTGENDKWFDWLMNNSSNALSHNSYQQATLGLNYALYDLVYRDGFPSETSPGYNFLWVNKIASFGDLLQRAGVDVFGIPKTKRLFDAVIDQVNAGNFTPDLGDAGGYQGYLEGRDATTFQTAYRYYKDPRYAAWLNKMGASADSGFTTVESLFKPVVEVPKDAKLPPAKPRLFDGYGLAVLNNPADTISMSMYYGLKAGHGHYDRLGFELFANGAAIMPDLGYPDAMNDFVPGIYTWSKNTISHNTVVVDAKRQAENFPGEVKLFANSPFARCVDVEASRTYPQCSTYRRAVIMVDDGPGQSYFVDIFNVWGGKEHDYSLHGPPGKFEMIGGKWSEPAKGTLAGEKVALGQIYDDPALAHPTATTSYSGYTGSGFQHLFNVRTRESGDWIAQFRDGKDPHAMLRIRVLDQPDQKMMLADAHVSPAKFPQIVKYLIARREGSENLDSRFVSVIEPFRDKPFILYVRQVKLNHPNAVELRIGKTDGTEDDIGYNPSGDLLTSDNFSTRANVAVDTCRNNTDLTRVLRVYDANTNINAGKDIAAPGHNNSEAPFIGKVVESLPMQSSVVATFTPSPNFDPQSLVGRVIFFQNDRHRTAHTVTRVTFGGDTVVLKLADDIFVGLAKVDRIDPFELSTFVALPLAKTYRGATVCDELFRAFAPVDSVTDDGKIQLAKPLWADHKLKVGDNVWLLDVGVGDTIDVPRIWYSDRQ